LDYCRRVRRFCGLAGLVGLAPAEADGQAVVAEGKVCDVRPHYLRPSERTGKAEQDQSAVAQPNQAVIGHADHGANVIGEGRGLPRRRNPKLCRMPLRVLRTMPDDVGALTLVAFMRLGDKALSRR
jgi:hypothetical protein